MKNLILSLSLSLGLIVSLTACGGGSGDGAKSTNGQPINYNNSNGAVTSVGPGVVLNPGTALKTPYSTAVGLWPEANLGAEFYRDSSGLVTLVQGELQTSQPFGYGQDCYIPSGNYALSTKQGGQKASNVDHHYRGIVINAVGPVSFTATINNVSSNDTSGSWKMQGAFTVSTVGNRSCSGYGIPIVFNFTYRRP